MEVLLWIRDLQVYGVLTTLLLYHHDTFREQFSSSYYFKALWSSDCLPSSEIPSTCDVSWQLLMNHHYILAGYPAQWIMKLPNLFIMNNLSNFSGNNEDRAKISAWKWANTSSSTFAFNKSCDIRNHLEVETKKKAFGLLLFFSENREVGVASLLMHGSCHTDTHTSLSKADEDYFMSPRPPQGCNFQSLPDVQEQNAWDWASHLVWWENNWDLSKSQQSHILSPHWLSNGSPAPNFPMVFGISTLNPYFYFHSLPWLEMW